MRLIALSVVIFTSFLLNAAGAEVADDSRKDYYYDIKKGWWWYEKEPEKPKKGKKEEQKETKQRKLPSLKDYTYGQFWDMHPDDFQTLLLEFQKKAVMTLSEQDVREYYIIQDIARRKSLGFANVASYVTQKYPELSVAKDYPVVTPGRNALVRQQRGEIENTVISAQDDFALLYFHSPA